jgi:DNA-binding MarR family transcriptional regulator
MGMTKGAITKLAQRLIDKGLVMRAANPADGRAQTLALTSRGRSLVPKLASIADENDAAFFGDLSPRARAELEGVMKKIIGRRGLKDVPTD